MSLNAIGKSIKSELVGHSHQRYFIGKLLSSDRLPGGLIFSGPSGVGKRTFALALAQQLLCESGPAEVCGECPSCLRVKNEQHESLKLIGPESGLIKIEKSRELMSFFSLQSQTRFKLAIIDQAHLLNPQASNALLKILEEPPERCHFILISSQPKGLLQTIRSRCQEIKFTPLKEEEIKKLGHFEDWIVKSSQGRIELAHRLSDESTGQTRMQARQFLTHLIQGDYWKAIALANQDVKNREELFLLSYFWQKFLRDALFLKQGISNHLAEGDKVFTQSLSDWSEDKIFKAFDLCQQFEQAAKQNGDKVVALEYLATQIVQAV